MSSHTYGIIGPSAWNEYIVGEGSTAPPGWRKDCPELVIVPSGLPRLPVGNEVRVAHCGGSVTSLEQRIGDNNMATFRTNRNPCMISRKPSYVAA